MNGDLKITDKERVNRQSSSVVREVPDEALLREMDGLEAFTPPRQADGLVGWTMFDTPSARDDTVVALLPKDKIGKVPNRGLVRIESEGDGRTYLGIVQAGPFAEPDGLRGDAPLVVTVQVRSGQMLLPQFHGRIHIELMGQKSGKGGDAAQIPPAAVQSGVPAGRGRDARPAAMRRRYGARPRIGQR